MSEAARALVLSDEDRAALVRELAAELVRVLPGALREQRRRGQHTRRPARPEVVERIAQRDRRYDR